AYYASALVFSGLLVWGGVARPRPVAGVPWGLVHWTHAPHHQYFIFLLGLATLSLGYEQGVEALSLGVLSWATFFIIDDWALLEHYVFRGGARLHWAHFGRLALFNALILGATLWPGVDLHARLAPAAG